MTLTARLTAFALTGLAVVLAGFSITLYALARERLYGQLDDRAAALLETLAAAAEVEADGLEWDRRERTLPLPRGEWAVFDWHGNEVDAEADRPLAEYAAGAGDAVTWEAATWVGEPWRVYRRTYAHPRADIVERRATPRPADARYQALTFVTAMPLAPARGTLAALAWALAGVSLGVWAAAAVAGRWVCRRALAPVAAMADGAKAMAADDLAGRLPAPTTGDELAALAAAFNDLLGRRQLAFERQRQFAAEASHQLRTPLTALLGQVEVALRRDRDPADYRRALTAAKAQADRLRDIVEALLFLAQADADAVRPQLASTDLARWLPAHVAAAWGDHIRSADVRATAPDGEALTAHIHPALLAQAVDNLIDNALKYSPAGTPVDVRVGREDTLIVLTVDDRGNGVRDDERDRVFEPFFRSADARRQGVGGVGLGLSVTARIVQAFGGQVIVTPRPDGGSRFEVRLPAEGLGRSI